MNKQEFLELFSKNVLQSSNIINDDANLLDIEDWDSLAQINAISFFDKELAITISFQDIQQAKSMSDILAMAKYEK